MFWKKGCARIFRKYSPRVEYLKERRGGLNQAVSQAIDWCCKRGASSVLVLPIDIPLVVPVDLQRMLALSEKASMVISPSRSGKGTNVLLLTPPNVASTFYGPQSFKRHLEEAPKRGISFSCYRSKRVALDIDTVEDLIEFILTDAKETNAYKLLDKIEIPNKLNMCARIKGEMFPKKRFRINSR